MSVRPRLRALETAVPPYVLDQKDVAVRAANLFRGRKDIDRLMPVFENTGIERRYSCVPIDWYSEPHGWKDRNELYVEHSLALFERIADACLKTAGLARDDIGAIVTVSTTGIATPSLDALLVERLGLRRDIVRLPIFGLGCAGSVLGMARAATLLGRPYSLSGHVVHGRKLGRNLGFRTLNLRFSHPKPAALGIFVVRTHGLTDEPLDGVASLGQRPTVDDSGRVLLEVYCLDWPASLGPEGGYGKIVRVELLHKLRDEARYDGLDALTAAIRRDVDEARAYFGAGWGGTDPAAAGFAAQLRQTTRDRIH